MEFEDKLKVALVKINALTAEPVELKLQPWKVLALQSKVPAVKNVAPEPVELAVKLSWNCHCPPTPLNVEAGINFPFVVIGHPLPPLFEVETNWNAVDPELGTFAKVTFVPTFNAPPADEPILSVAELEDCQENVIAAAVLIFKD